MSRKRAAGDTSSRVCLKVGDAVIAIDCPSPAYAASMRKYFRCRSSADSPDIRLALRIVENQATRVLPDSLFHGKRLSAEGFTIGDDLVKGRLDPETGRGELSVNAILTREGAVRVFEQLLYQAFYSVRRMRGLDSCLIHSSGVIHRDSGFLFVGESGSGKSTVAGLSLDKLVLNDEITLVSFTEDGVVVEGTPYNGYFRKKSPGRARLEAAFFLVQSPAHRLSRMSRAEAATRLFSQIVPPMGLDEDLSGKVRESTLDLAARLTEAVPFMRLEFRPDGGFWREIDGYFADHHATHEGDRKWYL